jgi:hypothetical protein
MYTLTKIVQNQRPNARARTHVRVRRMHSKCTKVGSGGTKWGKGGELMHFRKCKPLNLQQTSETTD